MAGVLAPGCSDHGGSQNQKGFRTLTWKRIFDSILLANDAFSAKTSLCFFFRARALLACWHHLVIDKHYFISLLSFLFVSFNIPSISISCASCTFAFTFAFFALF